MPHVIYIHIPYIILHLNVHIHTRICIRQAQESSQNSEGSWFCALCPLSTESLSQILVEPLCTLPNCRKGEGSGWAQGKAEEQGPRGSASCLIARSPADRHCSVFTSFHIHGRLRRSILTSTRRPLKYVEMV
jgi:hypothetical protein